MTAADLWLEADPTACPVCGSESCEEHLPPADGLAAGGREVRVVVAMEAERVRREARRRLDAEERPAAPIPEFETLRARLARPLPPLQYRIQGWQLQHQRVMLVAQFKSGKTTLVANYVRSLVDGDPFLGRYAVDTIDGTLVLLDLEMSERQLDSWYQSQQVRRDDRVIVLPLRGQASSLNILDDKVRQAWAARLRDSNTRVLVLDCFRPLADAMGLDEHKDAGRLLQAFDALLIEAQIGEGVLVHHMGHTAERARGDSRLRDWPDVEWRLVRRDADDPASPRFITAYGRDVDVPESQLVFDSLTRRLTIEDGSRRDAAGRDALGAVLAALDESPQPLSGRAVKGALTDSGHSRDAIDAALKFGVRMGALQVMSGSRNAMLYRRSGSVSGSVPECPADSVSECPAAYIEPDTHTLAGPGGGDPGVRTLAEWGPSR